MKCKYRLYHVNKKCKFSILKGYFSHNDCPILMKINRVEATDGIDKLCKFQENPT